MKTNILLLITIMVCLPFLVFSGEKDKQDKQGSAKTPALSAWVPEQNNAYNFTVLPGEQEGNLSINIEGKILNTALLSIINMKGEELYRTTLKPLKGTFTMEIPYNRLERGVYFVKVDSGDEIRLKKLVVGIPRNPMLVTASTGD